MTTVYYNDSSARPALCDRCVQLVRYAGARPFTR